MLMYIVSYYVCIVATLSRSVGAKNNNNNNNKNPLLLLLLITTYNVDPKPRRPRPPPPPRPEPAVLSMAALVPPLTELFGSVTYSPADAGVVGGLLQPLWGRV